MEITLHQFKMACLVASPCNCNAPLAYTFTYGGCPEEDTFVGLILYAIDIRSATVEVLYRNHAELISDQDNLNLLCTQCGASWVPFNPLLP